MPGESRQGRARRADSRFCGVRCRQAAWRLQQLLALEGADGGPRRLAYADPPYPGLAKRYYADQPSYQGEVDHAALVSSLQGFDGWALSTSARALRLVLPVCPSDVRVCAWGKPNPVPAATRGLHNRWEALIVKPARRLRPGVADWLVAQPARHGGDLMGRKPLAFVAWLFRLLGARRGDSLADLFPGTGVVGAAWTELNREYLDDASPDHRGNPSGAGGGDASLPAPEDRSSSECPGDPSRAAQGDA